MYLGKIDNAQKSKKLFSLFFGISVVVGGAILFVTLAKATVVIYPKEEMSNIDFMLDVVEDPTQKISSNIQGKLITTNEKGEYTIDQVSKKKRDKKATGTVTIYNNSDKEQVLVQQTRLLSKEQVLFRLTKRIALQKGEEVSNVPIEADEPGLKGNIQPTKFILPGLWKGLQEQIYAESTSPTSGGVQEISIVDQKDIADAQKKALDDQTKIFLDKVEKTLIGNERVSFGLTKGRVTKFNASVKPETETTSFKVRIESIITTVIIDESMLREIARKRFEKTLPIGKELVEFNDDSFQYSVTSIDLEKKQATITVALAGETRLRVANQAFDKNELKGKSKTEVEQYFQDFGEIERIEISFWPSWIHSFPSLDDKIEIIVKNPEQ